MIATVSQGQAPAPSVPEPRPWFRYPLVWMVIAGPAVVVVAGFATLWIAVRQPDPVIAEDYYRQGVEINKVLAQKKLMPAMAGRNHSATPADDVPVPPAALQKANAVRELSRPAD